MTASHALARVRWAHAAPLLAAGVMVASFALDVPAWLAAAVLVGAVLSAVHHAELIAHRVGEPFGSLLLAVAVTVIEAGLIVTLMLSGGEKAATLARDAVFAAVMIILNGIVGACLVIGGLKHREQRFGLHGVSAALATLAAFAVLVLVLPNFTRSAPGPLFSTAQLVFVAVVSTVLYLVFVQVQTVRHRDYFLPEGIWAGDEDAHAAPPSNRATAVSAVLLPIALVAVVVLAKGLAPTIESGVIAAGAPQAFVGIIIAAIVLLPEGLAAMRAAHADRLQTSLNLAIGSALAAIALTIPAVAAVSLIVGFPLVLGLDPKSTVLLALSLFVAQMSLGTGRTTVLHGAVHLTIFAVYLFVELVP